MQAFYGARGYKTFSALLGLQAGVFGCLLLAGVLARPAAGDGAWLQAVPAWLAAALVAAFMVKVWGSLCEAAFCLHLLPWPGLLKYQLRPLLQLAPVALVATGALSAAGAAAWLVRTPGIVVGLLGLLSSLLCLLQVRMVAAQVGHHEALKRQELQRLRLRDGEAATQRLADSLAAAQGVLSANPFQMRRGTLLADLPSPAWHERAGFAWAAAFEQAYEAIREEALRVCRQPRLDPYAYPGAVDGQWNVFWLVRDDQVVEEAERQCPATLAALRQVPGFPCFREAHFSILQPHSRILPHCDESNTWVTAHLGLQIPPDCGLRVGRETRQWKEGEFLFFDTSYQHEAWNDSDTPRVVLLFDFLHPGLSETEREFFIKTNSPDLGTDQAPAHDPQLPGREAAQGT